MGNKYKEEYKPGTNEYSWSYNYCGHTSAKGEPLSFDFSVAFGGPSVICLLILFHQHNWFLRIRSHIGLCFVYFIQRFIFDLDLRQIYKYIYLY